MILRQAGILLFVVSTLAQSAQGGPLFSGGTCISQGNWLQEAVQQSQNINQAIEALRTDENCKALVKALGKTYEASEKTSKGEREQNTLDGPPQIAGAANMVRSEETTSFANFYRELTAVFEYMRPDKLSQGLSDQDFRNVVFNVTFNKSLDAIQKIHTDSEFANLQPGQRDAVMNVSTRLKGFLDKSKTIANMSMQTARSVLAALPASKKCLHNKPSQAFAIFSAVTSTAVALATAGNVDGVGAFLGEMMDYSREMTYIRTQVPMELKRFENSVSCLIESTSEFYCSLQDAEDALTFLKDNKASNKKTKVEISDAERSKTVHEVLQKEAQDPVANPLAGLNIYMRDTAIIQNWVSRVLFGIDPRQPIEAQQKNAYWESFIAFVQALNVLPGEMRDQERLYKDRAAAGNFSDNGKLAIIKKMISLVETAIRGKNPDNFTNTAGLNFFLQNFTKEQLPFYLLNVPVPREFSVMNDFDTYWERWTNTKENGMNNPDQLLETVKVQAQNLIGEAKISANAFFAQRMIVDSLNLLSEAFKGPGVSPYQAFVHLRAYNANLMQKLERDAAALERYPTMQNKVRIQNLRGTIPLLKDTILRLDKVIEALQAVNNMDVKTFSTASVESQKIMDGLYEAANMLVSRDSFFSTRMQTALQADLSGTLWTTTTISDHQNQLLLSLGGELVNRLSRYFNGNSVLQKLDIASAKDLHMTNLQSVETLFAKVLFNKILYINCQLSGGVYCQSSQYDPVLNARSVDQLNENIRRAHNNLAPKGFWGFLKRTWNPESAIPQDPTEDGQTLHVLKGKLCIQALAFQSRDKFKEICQGAKLVSEYSDEVGEESLNMAFDDVMTKISATLSSKQEAKLESARSLGTCALRSYLRKNQVYIMYKDYLEIE